jgi:hypothetical protein
VQFQLLPTGVRGPNNDLSWYPAEIISDTVEIFWWDASFPLAGVFVW